MSPSHPARRPTLRAETLEDRCVPSRGVDVILEWNAVANQANLVDHTPDKGGAFEQRGPTRTARAFAIVHAAMYDAFNAIDRSGEAYLTTVPARAARDASADAAVATAAYTTLTALYPSQEPTFRQALQRTLGRVPNGASEVRGIAIGGYVAAAILADRQGDGSEVNAPYIPSGTGPGVFQTFPGEPAALDPNWGGVEPFALASGDQFLSDPPPALDGAEYAAAYNEVWTLGADDAETADRDGNGVPDRTADQTHAGIHWGYDGMPGLGTPPRLYNQIARLIARQERNSEAENARLFALVNLAMADAGIASWGTKYEFDVWRPLRGVRQVGPAGEDLDDGNPQTEAEADWTPLGAPGSYGRPNFTPPFPAYTSGHATFGAALFETLRQFYGRDDIAFTSVSDEYGGAIPGSDGVVRPRLPRSFDSFSEAEYENAQSRIYLGVHWGFDRDAGIEQGRAVADYVFANYLRERDHHGGHRAGAVPPSDQQAVSAPVAARVTEPRASASRPAEAPVVATPRDEPSGVSALPTASWVGGVTEVDPLSLGDLW